MLIRETKVNTMMLNGVKLHAIFKESLFAYTCIYYAYISVSRATKICWFSSKFCMNGTFLLQKSACWISTEQKMYFGCLTGSGMRLVGNRGVPISHANSNRVLPNGVWLL